MTLPSQAPGIDATREALKTAWLQFTQKNQDVSMRDGHARKMFKIRLLDDQNTEQSRVWLGAMSEKLRT